MKELAMRKTIATLLLIAASIAHAGDFDGSKKLICATVQGYDCSAEPGCTKGIASDMGGPAFLRVDVAGKRIAGAKVTTPILNVQRADSQLLLAGNELGFGWTMAIDENSGEMTVTMTNSNGVFLMFGSCTPI
jgi:hypothetical protein